MVKMETHELIEYLIGCLEEWKVKTPSFNITSGLVYELALVADASITFEQVEQEMALLEEIRQDKAGWIS